MAKVTVVEGEIYRDERGQISSLNRFRFDGVNRCYVIHHPDTSVVRGWNGHRFEKKWFYCLKGAFTVALVEIDNWENPSPDLQAEVYELNENESRIVCVPEGYANCMKAREKDSILLVYSGKTLEEAAGDNWKYDSSLWVDWSKY